MVASTFPCFHGSNTKERWVFFKFITTKFATLLYQTFSYKPKFNVANDGTLCSYPMFCVRSKQGILSNFLRCDINMEYRRQKIRMDGFLWFEPRLVPDLVSYYSFNLSNQTLSEGLRDFRESSRFCQLTEKTSKIKTQIHYIKMAIFCFLLNLCQNKAIKSKTSLVKLKAQCNILLVKPLASSEYSYLWLNLTNFLLRRNWQLQKWIDRESWMEFF